MKTLVLIGFFVIIYVDQTPQLIPFSPFPRKGCANVSVATLVKESTTVYTMHDQLFKQLITTFFEEFLEAFFP
ncbi:hypothetical protein GCM10011409_42080 [Lentibacillus populi]|uniref:Uncharacterized protein n=1 Tax=Lentibacillus populi TaxID=1827502 RepID=A0A9W5U190_9BACI|nr:hypothetical protein GCM10011409_42080 [Lentibacillus populi]